MIQVFPSRTVALALFGFPIHWYGLLYVAGFVIAAILLPRLQRLRGLRLSREAWLDVVSWAVVGVLVGGRLGFVLLYEPSYFLRHPLEIVAVWEGGMASHGGFLGVIIALWILAKRKGIDLWALADVLTVPAAIGLGLGRIGNFINQELYGTVTTLPWGITIPGVEGARHPLQIYDFLLMMVIAAVCKILLRMGKPARHGRIFAIFLVLYGVTRFFLEFIRDQQYPPLHLALLTLTLGQIYTLPLLAFGIVLWFLPRRDGL